MLSKHKVHVDKDGLCWNEKDGSSWSFSETPKGKMGAINMIDKRYYGNESKFMKIFEWQNENHLPDKKLDWK